MEERNGDKEETRRKGGRGRGEGERIKRYYFFHDTKAKAINSVLFEREEGREEGDLFGLQHTQGQRHYYVFEVVSF